LDVVVVDGNVVIVEERKKEKGVVMQIQSILTPDPFRQQKDKDWVFL
jgi:hypothetical protein